MQGFFFLRSSVANFARKGMEPRNIDEAADRLAAIFAEYILETAAKRKKRCDTKRKSISDSMARTDKAASKEDESEPTSIT